LPEPVSEAARDRVLVATVADHLDQSQRALLELANGSDDGAPDSPANQARAGELVAANRLYRQSASQAGEASLASVLDELERVLIEIANQPPDVTRRELREIRRRIDDEDLLFKIRVLSSQVRSREKKDSSKSLL
jgi:cytosine/adenosine deaminase-related metal-dependent hydrolase